MIGRRVKHYRLPPEREDPPEEWLLPELLREEEPPE